jgi:hypothetical protein
LKLLTCPNGDEGPETPDDTDLTFANMSAVDVDVIVIVSISFSKPVWEASVTGPSATAGRPRFRRIGSSPDKKKV